MKAPAAICKLPKEMQIAHLQTRKDRAMMKAQIKPKPKGAMNMELTYTRQGDFSIPNLTLRTDYPPLGKYGMLRKTYLLQNRKALFNRLAMNDTLWDHLSEVDKNATEMMERLTQQMAQAPQFPFMTAYMPWGMAPAAPNAEAQGPCARRASAFRIA